MKTAKTFRLSDEAVSLIPRIAASLGITETAVIELAVRDLAKKEKIK